MSYAIGVVAHESREDMAHELSALVDAKVCNMDDGALGCLGNHHAVQHALLKQPGWSVVLEDDAYPCNAFYEDLTWVLGHADSPVVSLYLGTGYPANWQPRIQRALLHDTSWIECDRLLHAVGYAIGPEIKHQVAKWLGKCLRVGQPLAPEDAISTWMRHQRTPVLYTNPSLVQHRDGPTTISARERGNFRGSHRPRHAWNTRQRVTWTDSTVTMNT